MADITSSTYPVVTDSKDGDQYTIVRNGQLKKQTRSALDEHIESIVATDFIGLGDTPGTYVGQVGKVPQVNATEDGLDFVASGLAPTFIVLPDTPSAYTGQGGKTVKVNSGETALEFQLPKFTEASDTPSSYTGLAGSLIRVNAGETGLEFFPDTGEIPNVQLINEESDLPAVNGSGEHELLADVAYWFTGSFTLTNPIRFIAKSTIVFGNDPENTVITYTGTGAAVRGTTGSAIRMKYIRFNSSADGIAYAGGTGATGENVILERVASVCSSGTSLSTNNVAALVTDLCTFQGIAPIRVSGASNGTFSLINTVCLAFAPVVALDFGTAVLTSINILGGSFVGIGLSTTAISGLVSGGNLAVGANARVSEAQFSNVTPLAGISVEEPKWRFSNNVGVAESNTIAFAYIGTPATTNIISAGVDYQVNGAWLTQSISERATVSGTGEITFQNIEEKKGPISATFVAVKLGGGTGSYTFKIQKDTGSGWGDITAVFKTVTLSTATASITILGAAKYKAGDKFRLTVRGVGTTDNVDVSVTQFVIGT